MALALPVVVFVVAIGCSLGLVERFAHLSPSGDLVPSVRTLFSQETAFFASAVNSSLAPNVGLMHALSPDVRLDAQSPSIFASWMPVIRFSLFVSYACLYAFVDMPLIFVGANCYTACPCFSFVGQLFCCELVVCF
jgi:hypothetical protein